MSKDHVPPKVLFPEPRPSDLFTVPSCRNCNGSFSKDDDYFRMVLVSIESVYDDKNARKVNKKFLSSYHRPEAKGFKKAIQNSLTNVDLISEGGIHVGTAPVMTVDAKRINAMIKRITKGLFFKTQGRCIPNGYQIDVFAQHGLFQLSEDFFMLTAPSLKPVESIGNGIFTYRYAVSIDNPSDMAFIFCFYDKLFFHSMVSQKKQS